jgi:hypothetical protein
MAFVVGKDESIIEVTVRNLINALAFAKYHIIVRLVINMANFVMVHGKIIWQLLETYPPPEEQNSLSEVALVTLVMKET